MQARNQQAIELARFLVNNNGWDSLKLLLLEQFAYSVGTAEGVRDGFYKALKSIEHLGAIPDLKEEFTGDPDLDPQS